jgi:radical SAM superfamily enzyme YgiQ (UPF0313 family)
MTDILLTHSYFLHFDPKQLRAGTPYPPLATLFAAAVLKQQGYQLTFKDTMFDRNTSGVINQVKQLQPRMLVIYDDGFNYLTKMCLTNMREAAFDMIVAAKATGCVVVVSASDATDHPEQYLAQGADYIIAGEAEQTLQDLAAYVLRCEGHIDAINGLIYQRDETVVRTAKRENLRNLDELPLPAWDMLDVVPYRKMWMQHKGYFSLNLVTTRGCPFKCNWCAKPIYGNRYNSRSPEHVVKEIKLVQLLFGVQHFWFADDIFGLKPAWVKRFAELVKQENLHFRFKIQSRVDLLLEEDNIRDLAAAGADEIWVGAESGSQKILDAMDKGTQVAQIEEATRLMKEYHIKPCFFLQFGYPGEQEKDIRLTIDMLKRLMPHDIGISVSYPLPGTKFYDNVKTQLSTKQNWTDSDELLVMFKGTYPADFYKHLQRLVHYRFRAWKALQRWKTERSLRQLISLAYRIPQIIFTQQRINKHASLR